MGIQGVVVDIDLGVQRPQATILHHDQRIDLDLAQILLQQQPQHRRHDALQRGDLLARQTQAERHFPCLIALETSGGIDLAVQYLFGVLGSDLLDVHAPGGGGHEDHAGAAPVHQGTKIQLTLQRLDFLDQHGLYRQARAAGLMRHQPGADQSGCGGFGFGGGVGQNDAARLAAAAAVDLGLDHPAVTAELAGGLGRFRRPADRLAARHLDAIGLE